MSVKKRVRRGGGEEASFGYPARSAYEVPTLPSASATTTGSNPFVGGSTGTSSFSPFSPDPNQLPQQQQHQGQQQQQQHGAGGLYAAAEMFGKRRDSYAGQPYGQGLPHPSKAYVPGFFPVPPVLQTNGSASRSAGSGLGSPTRGGYGGGGGDGFAGSPPAFQVNRYQRHAQPISRPNSGSARRGGGEFGLDAMHDLNGTLASLNLDQREERGVGGWGLLKSPTATEASVGGGEQCERYQRHEWEREREWREQWGERAVSDVDGVALSEDDLRCVLRAFACCVFACMRGGGWKALVLSSRCCCCRCPFSPCHHLAPSTLPPPPPGTRLSYALPMTSPSPPNARIEPIAYRRRPERNEYRNIPLLQHASVYAQSIHPVLPAFLSQPTVLQSTPTINF
ncbi:hypothetical protein B0H14DRAFT_3149174 [Mycena olivaceomarginata]|nr:hypothetical protein B0H14DRAFT_3149174 [Mycena olivaceomarginata]